ncbi:hypothetical protein E2C01_022470 [Portunus trituberculatus]|uniref:Uncharacterized protein n=1 Tax=Portunus trituberculatus TaxID=210409 RepID=A0A5B7E7R8_PORTR|nr:hypothetical protein [Portunus trituberculatus]
MFFLFRSSAVIATEEMEEFRTTQRGCWAHVQRYHCKIDDTEFDSRLIFYIFCSDCTFLSSTNL